MSRGTVLRLGFPVGLGFLTGVLLSFTPLSGSDGEAGGQFARIIRVGIWLIILAAFVVVAAFYGRLLLRRHYILEIEPVDATTDPLPMRPAEAAWAAQLETLGFRRLGELELRPRFDRPLRFWVYVNPDATIRASISRRWRRVSLDSSWDDATALTTTSAPRPTVVLPHYRYQCAADLQAAYLLHMQTVPNYGAGHGPATQIDSMIAYLAEEKRQHAVITPEIMAHQRWTGHVMVSALIVGLVVVLIVLWPF